MDHQRQDTDADRYVRIGGLDDRGGKVEDINAVGMETCNVYFSKPLELSRGWTDDPGRLTSPTIQQSTRELARGTGPFWPLLITLSGRVKQDIRRLIPRTTNPEPGSGRQRRLGLG
jgi:hypothetical protein